MEQINGYGYVTGGICWIVLVILFSGAASCAEFSRCGSGDLFLNAIVSLGWLAPSWFLAVLVSAITKNGNKDKS